MSRLQHQPHLLLDGDTKTKYNLSLIKDLNRGTTIMRKRIKQNREKVYSTDLFPSHSQQVLESVTPYVGPPSKNVKETKVPEAVIRMFVEIRNQTIDPFGDTMDAKLFYKLLIPKLSLIAQKLGTNNIGACVICNYDLYLRGMSLDDRLQHTHDTSFVVSLLDMLEIILDNVGVDVSGFIDMLGRMIMHPLAYVRE